MPTPSFLQRLSWIAGACVAGAVLGAGAPADLFAQATPAQPAAPAQAAPAQPAAPAQTVTFAGDGGVVFWQIKPDRTADFELVMGKYKEALEKSEDPARKQMAAGLHIYKTSAWVPPGGQEPAPQPNVLYLFVIDPVVKDADYSSSAILKTLYDVFPSEGQDLYKKFVESAAGGRNVLNLQSVAKGM
jgi:hypothetical protein